jgi:hypothetical protein
MTQHLPTRPSARRVPPTPARRPGWLSPVLVTLAAVGVLTGLFLFGVANFGRADPVAATTAAAGRTATTQASPDLPGVGAPVRDGKFEFVVTRVDCTSSKVGLEHLQRTAKGKYCVIGLTVRNIADRPQYFLGKAQKAVGGDGTGYRDDEIAAVYANHDTQTFLRKIDPGEQVAGNVVFDVPKATTLTTIELHDSLLSGGVRVALR